MQDKLLHVRDMGKMKKEEIAAKLAEIKEKSLFGRVEKIAAKDRESNNSGTMASVDSNKK